MSDARRPTRKGAAAFALMLACVPTNELSSYSRGSGIGGDAPTGPRGAAGGAGFGSGGLPGAGGSGGAEGTPSPDSGAPSEGGAGSSPPSPLPDAGGAPAAPPDAGHDAATGEPPDCPGGVLEANTQTCYFLATTAQSWLDARQLCENAGRALVKIESAAEDGFVADLSPASLWIGASDTAVDGDFVWSDGSPIVFSNWGGSQPDAFPGPDCVEKRQESGEPWYDQPCSNARLYVCERHLD